MSLAAGWRLDELAWPLFRDKKLNYGVLALQGFIGLVALLWCCTQAYHDQVKNEAHVAAAIRGIWSVHQFSLEGTPRPPLLTDRERWQNVIFDDPKVLVIQSMNGAQTKYYLQLDSEQKKFVLWAPPDTHAKANFTYDTPQSDRITLEGQLDGKHVTAELQRVNLSDPDSFLLINRGVHWVNQYAHNR